MIIIVMQKFKNRMMQLLRMLFVLAILIILIVQLLEAVTSIDINDEQLPKGDSVKVQLNVPSTSISQQKEQNDESWLDNLLNTLKSYHRGE